LPENHDAVEGRVLAGRHAGNLVTTSGNDTGIGIVVTGEFTPVGGGLRDPDSLLIGDFAVETASSDALGSDDTYAAGGFMLTGLDVNATYEFGVFASRRSAQMLATEYLITGQNVYRTELQTSGRDIGHDGEYDGNDNEIAVVSGVRPNEFGELFVDIEPLDGSLAYVNAMEIKVIAIPEPSSLTLLVIGWAYSLGVWRRLASVHSPADSTVSSLHRITALWPASQSVALSVGWWDGAEKSSESGSSDMPFTQPFLQHEARYGV
jgi:hypothetical protein